MKKKDALEELRGYMQTKPRMNARVLAAIDVAVHALETETRNAEGNVKRMAEKNRESREAHRCAACGEALPEGWKGRNCAACAERLNRRHKELGKALREKREQEHRCKMCGSLLPEGYGLKYCSRCLLKENARYTRYRENKKAKANAELI